MAASSDSAIRIEICNIEAPPWSHSPKAAMLKRVEDGQERPREEAARLRPEVCTRNRRGWEPHTQQLAVVEDGMRAGLGEVDPGLDLT